ncbi:RNase adapter RapZ [Erysipelothrix rhusiopathiae]|uniref:RNase adapter RapZ n=1 Tax=unclassified Erysipelothrix TaxID=2624170 RepID=UPI00137783F7|nr:RNase adapter RapZ [Erysipelothrix sp. strain 2 (EsS2-7-Brazil)]MBK2403821.1 RNase adapter RapZ [Erysipelothrix sp. strain 2 (EsS2-7-Brazil)]NBA01094.1 RNase adapter RapZ [Erysipelothrix rhusiopathiae]
MEKQKVVLVTGLSGAGKTSAMAVLEDMGYHCIDRFPVFMIEDLVRDIEAMKDGTYSNLALSVNAADFDVFYRTFKNSECELIVLFLDASKEQLLLRYKYNRRNHPLIVANLANGLEEAIDAEIEQFSNIKSRASIIIDTTFLTQQNLTSRIKRFFKIEGNQSLSLSFISFGYRKGLPMDADLVFDVRFLNNPYWEESLRSMTGNDKPVFDYVINDEKTQEFLKYLTHFLDYAFERYIEESKHLLTVAIGCTGGQHRSVSIVNWLYENYDKQYNTLKDHRDMPEDKE